MEPQGNTWHFLMAQIYHGKSLTLKNLGRKKKTYETIDIFIRPIISGS